MAIGSVDDLVPSTPLKLIDALDPPTVRLVNETPQGQRPNVLHTLDKSYDLVKSKDNVLRSLIVQSFIVYSLVLRSLVVRSLVVHSLIVHSLNFTHSLCIHSLFIHSLFVHSLFVHSLLIYSLSLHLLFIHSFSFTHCSFVHDSQHLLRTRRSETSTPSTQHLRLSTVMGQMDNWMADRNRQGS